MVLVLHMQLHGRFNQNGGGNHIGLVVAIQVVQEVSRIVLWCVKGLRGTEELGFAHSVLGGRLVLRALEGETVGDLNLKELELGLVNGEIRHLDVQAMEVNTAHTLLNVLRELAFTDLVEPLVVREGASLVELTEKLIYFKGGVVEHKLVPESALLNGAYLLVITDDLLEIPGEGENISMLLLIESHVDTDLSVYIIDINCVLFLLLNLDFGGVESARELVALKGSRCSQKRHESSLGANKSCLSKELSRN